MRAGILLAALVSASTAFAQSQTRLAMGHYYLLYDTTGWAGSVIGTGRRCSAPPKAGRSTVRQPYNSHYPFPPLPRARFD